MIPNVNWVIGGTSVYLEDDWRASTVANGGYNNFSGRVREDVVRRFSSAFQQGVKIRGYLDDGQIIWEGRLGTNPSFDNGYAFLNAGGHKIIAEKKKGRRLYQSREAGLFAEEGGSPFGFQPASTISATTEEGSIYFEARNGETVNNGHEHGLVIWTQNNDLRRLRATMEITGTPTGYTLGIERFSGPTGTRTGVFSNTPSNTTLDTGDLANAAEDALRVYLHRSGSTHTRTDTLGVRLLNVRVNGLIPGDSMEVSALCADVGKACGYDVTGLQTGPGIDTSAPASVSIGRRLAPVKQTDAQGRTYFGTKVEYFIASTEPAVVTSAMNTLPLDWTQGSWAALLDYVTMLLDWRWRVLGSTGTGPLLQVGPWGDAWNVDLASNTQANLKTEERFNKVIVKYRNASGMPAEVSEKADPDPLYISGQENETEFELSDTQPDDSLPRRVLKNILPVASRVRLSGSFQLVGADDGNGRGCCYNVVAGDQVNLQDFGPSENVILRVTETEMTKDGVSAGVGQHVDVGSMIAAQTNLARLRQPLGTISRYIPNKLIA